MLPLSKLLFCILILPAAGEFGADLNVYVAGFGFTHIRIPYPISHSLFPVMVMHTYDDSASSCYAQGRKNGVQVSPWYKENIPMGGTSESYGSYVVWFLEEYTLIFFRAFPHDEC